MPISVVFNPPLPSDAPGVFNTKAFTLLGDLNTLSTQVNAEVSGINAASATATTGASTATTQAGIATTQAGNAAGSASTATTQAGVSATQASNAATSASTATTQAGIATTQAGNASTSASNAASSASTVASAITTERTATATLTNKTLTSPVITGSGAITAGAGSFTTVSASGLASLNAGLAVTGAVTASGAIQVRNASASAFAVNLPNAEYMAWYDAGTTGSQYAAIRGLGGSLQLFSGGNTSTLSSTGLAVTGALSASGVINATGGQIAFPATQVASSDVNTLDDYEEGTWTPTLTCSTSGTITLGTALGTYTKIGRQVTVSCQCIVSSVSSPAGILLLRGFPFASSTSDAPATSLWIDGFAGTAVGAAQGIIPAPLAGANIYMLNNGSFTNTIAPAAQTNAELRMTATYLTPN